ncbi:hypothetical protein Q8A73_011585 [Channa argus]|nr:hypothetical protein Q8A73_011585 [Channa argus]
MSNLSHRAECQNSTTLLRSVEMQNPSDNENRPQIFDKFRHIVYTIDQVLVKIREADDGSSLRVGWRHEKEEEEQEVEEEGGCSRQEEGSPSNPPIFLHYCSPSFSPPPSSPPPAPLFSSLPPSPLPGLSTNETRDSGSFTEIDLKE